MVSREQLTAGGLRAYELGRLRTASRITLVLVPLAALCLFESRGREACFCLSTVLLGSAIWLRWRNRSGLESVTAGLQAGSIPLLAGVVVDALGVQCGLGGAASLCTGFAALTGGAAGVWIGAREHKWRGQVQGWLIAGAIATLTASLGCLRLGAVGMVSVVTGIAVGTVAMATLARRK
jgi:hypothetical protein